MPMGESTILQHPEPYDRSFEALAVCKKIFSMSGIDGHAVVCFESVVHGGPLSLQTVKGDLTGENSLDSRSESTPSETSLSNDSDATDSSETTHYSVEYAVWPARENRNLTSAVSRLSCKVALLVEGDNTVTAVVRRASPESTVITMPNGDKVQLFESLDAMAKGNVRRLQWAAFLRQENALLVWADEIAHIIPRLKEFTLDLFKILDLDKSFLMSHSDRTKSPNYHEVIDIASELESNASGPLRKPVYWSLLLTSIALGVNIVVNVSVVGDLVVDFLIDGNYWRLFYLLMIPLGIFMAHFFFQVVVGLVFNAFGPTKQLQANSIYYSATKPKRIHNLTLPTITVQIPVYMESLEGVIDPTVKSIQRAITEYELQGGTVNIFINDDGLQNLPHDQALAKMKYYATNNIGWTARPPHKKDGFIRKGRFKKASNMNYGLDISLQVEQLMESDPTHNPESALQIILQRNANAWGSGNVLMGELILIVDSDTRVPQDCFLDAAIEMTESPEVAILQHSSSAMVVIGNYWENGIAFFSNFVYRMIRTACACGESAPFVGHNAFLRWSAIKSVAFEEDNTTKFWSDSHVSEDFDMALRLQIKGYILRYASYGNGGFQEGVSLTYLDEIKRWEKYSFGCAELIFNPFHEWFTKGPITKLFFKFLTTKAISFHTKVSIVGYLGSYYAIAAGWIMGLITYLMRGLFYDELDNYFLDPFQLWLGL
ncbi:hypothetical protein HDU79_009093, partial [Rhizoclosmatium sp. JEL0117]